MELRVLEYFLAVAREQSISGAAEYLHLTQPTLSRQLRELEEELGLHARAEDLEFVGFHKAYRKAVFGGRLFKDHEISAVYIYRKPVETSALRLQKEELESVMWMDLADCRRAVGEGRLDNCMYPDELEMLSRRLSQEK